jgi:hypothetical protein
LQGNRNIPGLRGPGSEEAVFAFRKTVNRVIVEVDVKNVKTLFILGVAGVQQG